jgi:hypothetical protein
LDVEPEVTFCGGRNKKENMKKLQIAIVAISLTAALSASASITYSGTGLSSLTYVGNPGDAQYVAGTPDVAQLYTADSGTSGSADSPAVFVQGPMGTLNSFSASYSLYGAATGPSGTSPYWILWVSAPGDNNPNDEIAIIGMGGPTLNSSSAIHVIYTDNSYWGDSLGSILSDTYNGVAYGDMTVDWAGVEIGDWANGDLTIPASANIDSLTVPGVAVPEPTTMIAGALLLLPFGASTLRILRKNRAA